MPSQNSKIPDAASMQRLLSLTEVAKRWRCTYNAAHRRLRKSGAAAIALSPSTLRFRLSEIISAE
jgi:hypothetical protein